MRYCPKCGSLTSDHGKFCGKCGAALTAPSAAASRLRITTPVKDAPVETKKKTEKKQTMAARATRNDKPTMASQAVIEAKKREEFLSASLKKKRAMMDAALNELLDGRLPKLPARLPKLPTRKKATAAA